MLIRREVHEDQGQRVCSPKIKITKKANNNGGVAENGDAGWTEGWG